MFIKREKNDVVKLYEDNVELLEVCCDKVVSTKTHTIVNYSTNYCGYGVIVINDELRSEYNVSYITYYYDDIRIRFNIVKYYNNDDEAIIPDNINDVKYEDLRKITYDNLKGTVFSDDYCSNFEFFINDSDEEFSYIWEDVDPLMIVRKFANTLLKYYDEFYDDYYKTSGDIIKSVVKYVRNLFSKQCINTTVCAVFDCMDEYEDIFTKVSYMEGSDPIITVYVACNDVLRSEFNINRYTDLVLIGLVASK